MIERNRYYYTKLGDLKIKDNVSVWAVVAFISHAGGMDKCSNFGTIPLSNSMIVRIHRCRVRIASNNQVTIIGRINCAGLHVVAWCVDDLDCSTRYNSSDGFTFDPQLDAQRLDELRRPNCYFDVVCQIVAVHVPFEGFGGATYLSVCDGTKAQMDGNFYCVGGTHTTQSQMFSDGISNEHIKDFVYVIGCWDDYAEKAKKFEAGDIVRILNAKVGPKDANGLFHLSLHGHTANSVKYKRGIECVRKAKRRPSDRGAEDGATEAESDAHPSGKRTRQREGGEESFGKL
uniref:POT1PC domain-containing protein n=1 Tax=Globodera pallida TaxID=36090 RepID=A0A183CAL8_GLOPA